MSSLAAEFLLLASDDFVYLAELPYYAARVLGVRGEEDERRAVLATVCELLHKGLWLPGELRADGFHSWSCSAGDALARIEREWRALGRPLTIGDVCWFANTPDADARAGELLRSGYKSAIED